MLLSARLLNDCTDLNHFSYVTQVECSEGDSPTVYIQLTDISLDAAEWPRGRRYMPPAGATLSVTLRSLQTNTTLTITAIQPFPQDPSIWSFDLAAVDTVPGTRALKLALTEGAGLNAKVTQGWVEQAIVVNPMAPEF